MNWKPVNHVCSSPKSGFNHHACLVTLMQRSMTSLSLRRGMVQASMHYRPHLLDVVVLVTRGCQFSVLTGMDRSLSLAALVLQRRAAQPKPLLLLVLANTNTVPTPATAVASATCQSSFCYYDSCLLPEHYPCQSCQVTEDASSWVNAIAPQSE